MGKREEFGLVFYKSKDERHDRMRHWCMPENEKYADLSFIDAGSDIDACVALRAEIVKALNSQPYLWTIATDQWEDMFISIEPPNIKVNDLTISLSDMKALLDEWITFATS